MNDTGGIRFDTTNVRGFAEYMHHLLTTKYQDRALKVAAKLAGGGSSTGDGRSHSGGTNGSMGSSGIEYYGLDIGKAEVENARAGASALEGIITAYRSMANGAAYAAEEYSGQDADNADELGKDLKPGDQV